MPTDTLEINGSIDSPEAASPAVNTQVVRIDGGSVEVVDKVYRALRGVSVVAHSPLNNIQHPQAVTALDLDTSDLPGITAVIESMGVEVTAVHPPLHEEDAE